MNVFRPDVRLPHLRTRFWFEVAAVIVNFVLFGVTLAVPSWIEFIFHVEPDGGSGALESIVVLVWLSGSLVMSVVTGREWRRSLVLTAQKPDASSSA